MTVSVPGHHAHEQSARNVSFGTLPDRRACSPVITLVVVALVAEEAELECVSGAIEVGTILLGLVHDLNKLFTFNFTANPWGFIVLLN